MLNSSLVRPSVGLESVLCVLFKIICSPWRVNIYLYFNSSFQRTMTWKWLCRNTLWNMRRVWTPCWFKRWRDLTSKFWTRSCHDVHSRAPVAWRAAKRSLVTIGTRSHAHRNKNPCNPFLLVNMDRGLVRPTTTSRNMATLPGLIPSLYSVYLCYWTSMLLSIDN